MNAYDMSESSALEYRDLRGVSLRGSDLRDADLRDTDLRDADLRGANLGANDVDELKEELAEARIDLEYEKELSLERERKRDEELSLERARIRDAFDALVSAITEGDSALTHAAIEHAQKVLA